MKMMNDFGEELTRNQAKIIYLVQDIKEQKGKTKEKYKIIIKFAQDVYKIVQTKKDEAYKHGLMTLNQNYVMSDAAYTELGKKKDIEHIEQLDRELRYKERKITTLKINAIKREDGNNAEIQKKTTENIELIGQLNKIKEDEKMLNSEIKKQEQAIEDLKMELNQKKKQMAQDLTIAKNDAAIMLQTHGINPGRDTKKQEDERVQSAQKSSAGEGGNFFQKKKENLEDKARIMELI